jgi:hypothetical protein
LLPGDPLRPYPDRSCTGWTAPAFVGAFGNAGQGLSVALSADGNTAIIGWYRDNSDAGAAWVFTRNGGAWTQQDKRLGAGAVGLALQGISAALSADGNTAIVGGFGDGANGAAWVFTRSGGVWTQQGSKLVGTGAVGNAGQGLSVALSADGNTAMVGGRRNSDTGAAWAFTRSGLRRLFLAHAACPRIFRNTGAFSAMPVSWRGVVCRLSTCRAYRCREPPQQCDCAIRNAGAKRRSAAREAEEAPMSLLKPVGNSWQL